jgi:hypothetical protein
MMSKTIGLGGARSLLMMLASAATMLALTPAAAQTADKTKHMIEGVRDARYCELIPVVRHGVHLIATVYNTLGLNDCPPDLPPGAAGRRALRHAVLRADHRQVAVL